MRTGEECKERVMHGYHLSQCSRKAVKDGYCKQHHPDSVAKRKEENEALWKKKQAESPWAKLEKASLRIGVLEASHQKLLEALKDAQRTMRTYGTTNMRFSIDRATDAINAAEEVKEI